MKEGTEEAREGTWKERIGREKGYERLLFRM